MIQRMAGHLHATGQVQFTVCSLGTAGPIGTALRSEGIEVIALGGRGDAVRQVLTGALRLRRLLKRRRFDLIHSFLYRSHCASRVARFGQAPRVPLISAERCMGDNRSGLVRLANRLTSRMSDRVLAVSRAVAERIVTRDRVPRDRVAVVANGIESTPANPRARARLRRALGMEERHALILYLGRLHREKGPDLLLEALALLKADLPDGWSAVLVGGGEETRTIAGQSVELGLGQQVRLPGPRRQVGPWLDACDLIVLPSREEGMPVAALEAMMRSRPVVATRVGGTPEVVSDGETGLLVEAGDPVQMADALARLIRDPGLRISMGQAGRRRAMREFTIDAMAAGTLRQYRLMVPAALPASSPAEAAGVD
jgi:glycosyltransferase involved in cell wall biosynthesis